MTQEVTRDDILAAAVRIAPHVRRTPTLDLGNAISPNWSLALKLDHLQVTGSFKARGAFNALLTDGGGEPVVAASGGNFGKAVAFAAHELALPATIFVPESSPSEKIESIARYGATVNVVDGYYDQALAASREFAQEHGGRIVHAFDQHAVVAGQGTVGLEVGDQIPERSSILVPVGGGGLIGGVASWFREDCRVVAVEPERCPTLFSARAASQPVEVDVGGIAVSSLGARKIGEQSWAADKWIDSSVLVAEGAIVESQQWLWDQCRLHVEPAGAVALAGLRSGTFVPEDGEVVVALITGANLAAFG
jgi:threonine dehydratase